MVAKAYTAASVAGLLVALTDCGGGRGETIEGEIVVLSTGGGRITASPSGGPLALDCGPVCRAHFEFGSTVSLTASPAPGETFLGWDGACSGTGECLVTLEEYAEVSASFGPPSTTWSFGLDGRATGDAAVGIGDAAIVGGTAGENSQSTREHLIVQRVGEPVGSNWTLMSNGGGVVRDLAATTSGTTLCVGGYDGALQVDADVVTDAQDGYAGFILLIDSTSGVPTGLTNVDATGSSEVRSVAALSGSDFVVAGTFADSLVLGSDSLSSAGNSDVFVGINQSGSWTTASFGSNGDDAVLATNSDQSGRIWVLADFAEPTLVGGSPAGPGFTVLLLDALLNPLNVFTFGGERTLIPSGAIARSNESVVVAVSFAGTLDVNATPFTAAGDSDWLLVTFKPDATVDWARQYGGAGTDFLSSVAYRGGALYLVGSFEGQFDYADQVLYSHSNATDPSTVIVDDGIVVRVDATNGDPLWARRFGGWGADGLNDDTTLSSGVLAFGTFAGGPRALGSSTPSNLSIAPAAVGVLLEE
jgi:hypothetical protein